LLLERSKPKSNNETNRRLFGEDSLETRELEEALSIITYFLLKQELICIVDDSIRSIAAMGIN
jgi:hypothetical protein